MRLLLQPPKPDSSNFEVDQQIHMAVSALHDYLIRIRGAGRFADGSTGILLAREMDAPIAVAALKRVGIQVAAS